MAHVCHVDRHGQFTLKQLRLSLVNEMPTNSYTGPRLNAYLTQKHWNFICANILCKQKPYKQHTVEYTEFRISFWYMRLNVHSFKMP